MKKISIKSKIVSEQNELALYELFGYTLEKVAEDMAKLVEGKEPANRECEYLQRIKENPFLFFKLPKSALYLHITKENPWFYNSALKAFELGIKAKEFKKFIEERNITQSALVVKTRKDYLKAKEEVDEIIKCKNHNM